ncbi:MAG: SDR family oxidoreductase [Steroidobacteraceae bacterium]|jgi:NAD(P)-dependent dehydrogenase (short-subunit alcohol dehydrogenase family)|nr:SDR family oxidoreductase [Steroidobacteraceae bacterium]
MPVVLITGANRGLGLEFARQYAESGWKVLATCRDPAGAGDLHALRASCPALEVHPLDVADFATIDALAGRLAGRPIDVLLNNAGVFGPKAHAEGDRRQEFGSMDYGIWAEVLRVNLMAPMKMAEAFVEHVAASTQKKLVAISSTEGSSPNAKGGIHAYRTSKAALNMLMQNLAPDLAPRGIVTAAFCPGWIKTRMGGPRAPLEAPPSIAGLRRVIDGLTPERSGKFWLWTGQALPW